MKTLKMIGMAFVMTMVFATVSKAQTYVTFQAGVTVPAMNPPGVVYVNPYGAPIVANPYGGGCNRVYVTPYGYGSHYGYGGGYYHHPHYNNYGYGNGYGYGGCNQRHGYGGHGHH